jgi:zinc protease
MTTLARGLTPVRAELDNGVVLLIQQTSAAPAVTVHASVLAGCLYEPAARPGLAHLTAKLLDRGTAERPAGAIAGALDDRGVALKISASRHAIALTATSLSEDLPDILSIVADVIRHPTFPPDQLQRRRAELVTGLRQDDDNPFLRAGDGLVLRLYGADHPYGRPPKGTVASLSQIDRGELVDYHNHRFRPSTLTVAIVGDVEPLEAVALAERAFGSWQGGVPEPAAVPAPPRPAARRVAHIDMPGKAQADIAYGFTTISRLDPRYYAYWMMNIILGEFGLGGRLAANIRERQGMAYYAFSSFDAALGEGPLIVRAGVDPLNVVRAIAAIDVEVGQLGSNGPTAAEVAETRQFLIGSIPRFFETNQGIAAFLQTAEYFGLGLDYDRRLPGLIEAVTHDDVAAAAAGVLRPEAAAVVVAGPAEVAL